VAPLQPGGTVKDLTQRIDLDPETYADHVLTWIDHGATVIGGCCEISPQHIAHLHQCLNDRNIPVTSFNQ
jgi:Homocysteine/selenocysteine methylase (S-methylmethionine-dependent)